MKIERIHSSAKITVSSGTALPERTIQCTPYLWRGTNFSVKTSMEFKLRPLQAGDAGSLVKYGNNPAVAINMADSFPSPYTAERANAFLEMVTAMDPVRIWGIEINGEIGGVIGLHPQSDIMRRNAELGYWLGEPFWGNGIIARAIPQVLEMGFRNLPEINRIFARPFGRNKRSQRVLEKAGMEYEYTFKNTIFKNGKPEDELFYSVRRPGEV